MTDDEACLGKRSLEELEQCENDNAGLLIEPLIRLADLSRLL